MKGKVLQSGGHKRYRRSHMIPPVKGNRLPQSFVFFDTETENKDDQGTQRLKCIVACHWTINNKTGIEKTKWFHTVKPGEFYKWLISLLKRDITTRVMSANIWFDFRNSRLYDYMKKDSWQCIGEYSKGMTAIFKWKKEGLRLDGVNIQNYFQTSVAEIGRSIGITKKEVDFKTVKHKELLDYCYRDVEIIYRAIQKLYHFVKDNKLGGFPYTIPSLAFSIYSHSFMQKWLMVHDNKEILELERKAYFGGRCECFRLGQLKEDQYYYVDINSMYPYVMRESYFPISYVKSGKEVPLEAVLTCAHAYCYVAECEIETDKPIYAYRKDGKLIFPIGKFVTYLTTPSLLYGISNNHVKRIIHLAVYKKAKIFTGFINYFYEKRVEFKMGGNLAFAYACKLLMNALYGKFGQRATKMEYEGYNSQLKDIRRKVVNAQTGKRSMHNVFMGHETLTVQGEEEAYNSIPAISAHVTDYARVYLWLLIKRVGAGNYFYVDTDSLIVNEAGHQNLKPLIHPDQLGMLKIEGQSTNVEIRGPKDYTFGKRRKIKGVPAQAIHNVDGSYTYPTFPGMRSELRSGLDQDYVIGKQTKRLKRIYDKGEVMIDGEVLPFVLPATDQKDSPVKVLTWPEWIQKVGGINSLIEKGEYKLFTYRECGIKGLVKSKGQGKSFDELRELAAGEERIAAWMTLNDFKEMLAKVMQAS